MRAQTIIPCAMALSMLAGAAWAQTTQPAAGQPATAPTAMPPPTAPTAQSAPAAGVVPPDRMGAPVTMPANGPAATGSTNGAVNTSAQTAPGAPFPGANSFTEGEAKSRIEGRGFSQVSDLKLDGKGIWRGTASRDGKSVNVALDYQGNVVAE